MQKLLKLNNKTLTNRELLQLRYLNDYVGLETIKQLDNGLRLVLIQLKNNNFITVKVIQGESNNG